MNDALGRFDLCLRLETFRLSIKNDRVMVLPPYKGAVFRGSLINAFRRLVCAVPRTECDSCLLKQRCLYAKIFEPSFGSDFQDAGKYRSPPRPYVVNPPLTNRKVFHPGEVLDFDLVLMGDAIDALPYFVYSFMEIGRRGIGSEAGRRPESWGKFHLDRVALKRGDRSFIVYDGSTQSLKALPPATEEPLDRSYPMNGGLTLNLLTPLRLKVNNKLATSITFPVFFKHLRERILLLSRLYGDPAQLPPLSPAETLPLHVETTSRDLFWYEWERYSTRQKEHHKFGGLKGKIGFAGDLAPFLPYLRMGERVNVGSNATFGQGKYEVSTGIE